ncbi:palmitoyltransferase ZDHHC12 [Microcaecilia unicolor]|uniref:Palmitoyltransferase n=1 Tax=Microcaecilia unicolor TaxID=1415580 RepID=A0A6P7YKZ0_9AMPH|nr:probable palmitoyltransferase ZDHHC12 [Microcaecilia unicolor]
MFCNVLSTGFVVRAAHTVLTWTVTLVLFLHSADLHHQKQFGDLSHPLLFVLLVLCSVLLYFAVSLMDPGYVTCDGNVKVLVINEEQEEMVPQTPKVVHMRRCGYCMLQQPMRARHCKACQHCVRRYDHHCPWIGNCVGERNHPLFIIYLVIQLVVLLWAFHLAWSGFHPGASWTEWMQLNMFLLLAFAIITIFTVVVILLLVSHLYLVSCNVTSWEFMSYHHISYLKHCPSEESPFDRGISRNLYSFFCTCHTVAWEKIYFQFQAGHSLV